MKLFALAAVAVAFVVSGGVFGFGTSTSHAGSAAQAPLRLALLHAPSLAQLKIAIGSLKRVNRTQPLQAANPTATATAGPQPTPTATVPAGPDPVTVLQNALQAADAWKTTQFEQTVDGEQANVEQLKIDGKGKASCSGPSELVKVTGSDVLLGTSQSTKISYTFIEKGSGSKLKDYIKNSKTKQKWAKATHKQVLPFGQSGFSVDNPLSCGSAGSSSG